MSANAEAELNRNTMPLRQKIRFYLDDTETVWGRVINGAIASLILLSAAIFVIETYPLSVAAHMMLRWADWIILGLFTVEYGCRVVSAERPLHYLLSFYALVDLVAILPFWLGWMDARFVRLLRWLRILRLIRFMRDRRLLGRLTTGDSLIFAQIVFTVLSIVFIYSGLIFQVEHANNPQVFTTFVDAIYFAVVTMTTVGFGDLTPVSESGRLLTVLMILTGVVLIPTQVGNLIRHAGKVANALDVICPNCEWPTHEADALFCKRCGYALPHPPSTDHEAKTSRQHNETIR